MKINSNNFALGMSLIILAILGTFSSILSLKLPTWFMYILPCAMLIMAVLSTTRKGVVLIPSVPSYFYAWIFFSLFVLVSVIRLSNLTGSLRILCSLAFCVVVANNANWLKRAIYIVGGILSLNVFFTYFFWFFPQFYSIMIDIYGYVPSGTSNGTAGYRAGIANHYSQNGIFISVFLILLVVLLLARISLTNKKVRHNKLLVGIIIATCGALLLTGKRGVLIWSIGALVITYLISSKHKPGRFMRLALIALAAIGVLQVLSETIPAIAYVFERFQNVGEDTASLERLSMWELAIEKFKESPIFGNGFWSFRSFYQQNLAGIWHANSDRFQTLDAHNVYLQVLCETGIVGEIIYLLAIGLLLRRTFQIVRQLDVLESVELRFGAMFSLSIQIFYCLYSLTGNCLYDIVFYFYALAAAMTLAIDRKMKQDTKHSLRGDV